MEFFSIWGTEKVAGLWFATGGSAPRLTLCLPSLTPPKKQKKTMVSFYKQGSFASRLST